MYHCLNHHNKAFTTQHQIRRVELRLDNILVQSQPVLIGRNEKFYIFIENFGLGSLLWEVIQLDYPVIGLPPVSSRSYAIGTVQPRKNIVKSFLAKTGGGYALALARIDDSIPVSASGLIEVAPNIEHTLPLP